MLVDRSHDAREEITVEALAARAATLAATLRRAGVRRGEAVGYQLGNRWEAVGLLYACAHLGAVAVPVPMSLGPAQVEQRLASTGAVAVVTEGAGPTDAVHAMASRLPDLRTTFTLDVAGSADDLHREAEPDDPAAPDELGPDDVALVLFTSGTTGASKGVLHTANTLHAATRGLLGELLATDDDPEARVMTSSVVTHVIGIMTSAISPVLHSHRAVLIDRTDPADLLAQTREEQVTHLLIGPRPFDGLLDLLAPDGSDAPGSLRLVALGGAPLAAPVARKADRVRAPVRIHWGMTEVPGGNVSRVLPGLDPEGRTAVGEDAPGTSLHTLGHAGHGLERRLAPTDDEGGPAAFTVRGPQVTVGTFDSSDGSEVWTPAQDDGWFTTGDLAGYDDTGEAAFVDRDSDEIKASSGMLIPTADVEDLLNTHPAVSEVVLVAFHPHAQAEAPAAVVAPMPGHSPTLDDLRAHLREHGTTEWYAPERLELVERLPRDPQGKVDKAGLRARLDGTSS